LRRARQADGLFCYWQVPHSSGSDAGEGQRLPSTFRSVDHPRAIYPCVNRSNDSSFHFAREPCNGSFTTAMIQGGPPTGVLAAIEADPKAAIARPCAAAGLDHDIWPVEVLVDDGPTVKLPETAAEKSRSQRAERPISSCVSAVERRLAPRDHRGSHVRPSFA